MDLFLFVKFSSACLFKLCTMWVKVAIGIRPLGFLDNCSTSCHESFPSCEDRSLHVLSTEYKCPSLRPVNQEETMISDTSSVFWLYLYCLTRAVLRIQHSMKLNRVLPVGLTVSAARAQRSPTKPLCREHSLSRLCSTNWLRD